MPSGQHHRTLAQVRMCPLGCENPVLDRSTALGPEVVARNHLLRLSQPGRVFFTVALLVGVAAIDGLTATGRAAHPWWCSQLLLVGVITLDAVGRGVVAVVRRLILDWWAQASFLNTRRRRAVWLGRLRTVRTWKKTKTSDPAATTPNTTPSTQCPVTKNPKANRTRMPTTKAARRTCAALGRRRSSSDLTV